MRAGVKAVHPVSCCATRISERIVGNLPGFYGYDGHGTARMFIRHATCSSGNRRLAQGVMSTC